jgi:hypothetical protein
MESVVSQWFGAGFERLHPLLQALHLRGGVLTGPVEITLGRGLARPFGQAIARRLGIPLQPGPHTLRVEIGHQPDRLLWNRCFDDRLGDGQRMDSTFRPVGMWPEQTGPVRLGTDCRSGRWRVALALPQGLAPWSKAAPGAVSAIHRL